MNYESLPAVIERLNEVEAQLAVAQWQNLALNLTVQDYIPDFPQRVRQALEETFPECLKALQKGNPDAAKLFQQLRP